MRAFTQKHRRGAAFGVVVILAVTATAFAYWTGGGSGSGSGNAGTSSTVTLTGVIAPGIAPGTSRPVSLTAANASGSPITVSTVHLESVAADGGHAACATDDFSMADVSENHQVPAGATSDALPNAGTLTYANTAANQDACKDATLTVVLSSS